MMKNLKINKEIKQKTKVLMLCAEEFSKNLQNILVFSPTVCLLEAFSNVNTSVNSQQIRVRSSSERGRMVLHKAQFHSWKSKH